MSSTRSKISRLLRLRGSERCLVCGKPVDPSDAVVRLHDVRVHKRCASYRRERRR